MSGSDDLPPDGFLAKFKGVPETPGIGDPQLFFCLDICSCYVREPGKRYVKGGLK